MELGRILVLEGKSPLTSPIRILRGAEIVTSSLPYSKFPTPKELINSHLESEKFPARQRMNWGGTSEEKKPPHKNNKKTPTDG